MKKINAMSLCMLIACSSMFLYYFSMYKSSDKNLLIVGTSADYPPYATINLETNEIVGFDIDIVREVACRLGKKIELRDMPFNYLMFDLYLGQIDVIAAGLTPDEDRKKAVLFSKPYLTSDPLIIVTKREQPALTDITELYGKSVAVNTGYTSDMFLSKYSEISLVRLKATADAIMALQANSIYAFATSQSSLSLFLSTQKTEHDFQFFTIPTTEDSYALAYQKNNEKLQQKIDDIIDQMEHDGTLQKIKQKWGFA